MLKMVSAIAGVLLKNNRTLWLVEENTNHGVLLFFKRTPAMAETIFSITRFFQLLVRRIIKEN
ncbi:MAG TPA: hypothetical protein VF842_05765, partial [Flavobacterium sp.]